ncbi:hypothetical protein BJY01DRAFT_245846 [Aspergillus pseudoustus]|uniref:Uncharacterized protein n=1 Tax=Aspergillus pseudoustus TaxID=1810923 RepID=A0ABR4KBC8_9EURO
MEDTSKKSTIDYNQVLLQIAANLTNALDTYGRSSRQYQIVLEMLKDYMALLDKAGYQGTHDLDPETLSLAMGFLEIGK